MPQERRTSTRRSTTRRAEHRMRREDESYLQRHRNQLSRSTQRAHWIGSPEERAERNGQTLATRNPEVIRKWAEERRARPAMVKNSRSRTGRVLRMNFPGYSEGSLQEVSWDEWQRVFNDRDLTFLYQEKLRDGRQSNFFRLDSPKT